MAAFGHAPPDVSGAELSEVIVTGSGKFRGPSQSKQVP